MGIKINSIYSTFGSRMNSNAEAERKYALPSGFILEKTGIKQRFFWGHGQTPEAESVILINRALDEAQLSISQVKAIYGSSNPWGDVAIPSATHRVASMIGFTGKISHVNYGCGGYFSGIEDMVCWLKCQPVGTHALLVLQDWISKTNGEYNTGVLFSDAVSVSLWSNDPNRKGLVVKEIFNAVAPGDIHALGMKEGQWHMDGSKVAAFAQEVPQLVAERMNIRLQDFDLVTHQPSKKLLDTLEEIYQVPFYKDIAEEYGNATCSSAMIALSEYWLLHITKKPILSIAFGDSLSYGAMIFEQD